MNIVFFMINLFISFLVGIFGFAQIIGSLQHIKQRGIVMTIVPIAIWIPILFGAYYMMNKLMHAGIIGCYVGYGYALFKMMTAGEIQ